MKYLTLVTTTNGDKIGAPPPELMQAIMELGREAGAKMTENGGMMRTGIGRVRGGELVIDGPFTETKEIIAGYATYELDSEAEAMEWTRRFLALHQAHWPEWDGEVEVLQVLPFGG